MLLASLVLTSCQQPETDLPFSTIEQRQSSGTGDLYENKEIGLVVVSSLEETTSLSGLVTQEAYSQLQTMNYTDKFALALFQGWKPSDGYAIQIERISHVGERVSIMAKAQEPEPNRKTNDIVTSPYHLVQVESGDLLSHTFTFEVIVGGSIITSTTHLIP
jgi:hypothetical protein